jgi:hypothetical protein
MQHSSLRIADLSFAADCFSELSGEREIAIQGGKGIKVNAAFNLKRDFSNKVVLPLPQLPQNTTGLILFGGPSYDVEREFRSPLG